MPFCRECGKVVEEDWVTCPFCTHSIGPPASNSSSPNIQDSVIMGDVNAGNELICPHCSSIGSVLIACVNCREISYCSTCEPEIIEKRHLSFPIGTWIINEGYSLNGQFPSSWNNSAWKPISRTRCCDDCWNKWYEKIQYAFVEEVRNWLGLDLIDLSKQYRMLDKKEIIMAELDLGRKMKKSGFDASRFKTPTLESINE